MQGTESFIILVNSVLQSKYATTGTIRLRRSKVIMDRFSKHLMETLMTMSSDSSAECGLQGVLERC